MLLPPSSFKIVSIYSLGLSLSPECFLSFLSNVYIPICVGKMFKVMVFIFLETPLNIGIFTYASLFTQNLPPSCYHHSLDRGKLLTPPPPGSIFFENLFPSTEERGWKKLWFALSKSIRNCEDDFEHWLFIFCMIFNFVKWDGFTFL